MKQYTYSFSAFLLTAAVSLQVFGAPVINEFLASNTTIYPDNRDFDDYSDWIELYNPDPTNQPLTNCFLTDDLTLPFKWFVPAGVEIPAGGYLVIRADGFDAGPGETRSRGYWPWGSTFVTRYVHAGFKLSAAGEAIGLFRSSIPPVESTLISTGELWKYLDTGGDPGAGWMFLAFDDSAWSTGTAELGYGDGDETTIVSYGPNASAKYATTHFRHRFVVADPTRLSNLRLRVLADDGAIVYLNGAETARIRMPTGAVGYGDYTGLSASDYSFESVTLSAADLLAGTNVIAVEVHQASANSSDLSFNAELLATEVTGTPILIDSIVFGPQTTDVSYGRDPASTNGWSLFGEPTPGAANDTEPLTQSAYAPAVAASVDSGFYTADQMVSLSAPGAGAIRYTLDGSVPTSASTLYTNALSVTATTTLRARAFSSGLIPGPVLTRSFFLGADAAPTLPVFSITAEPDTFFGNEIGIYENDTSYAFKGREVPVRVELFETNRQPAFAVSAGVRIAGENIWSKAQKPLNIYCRSKYGDDQINYQIFRDEPVGTFGQLNLRNGGDDWEETLLRDAMMPSILSGQVRAELYSYRPGVLYLNGEYRGIYNMRKRFDSVYFANEHYLASGDYDQLAYAHDSSGVVVLSADAGSTADYLAFKEFFTTNDLSDPAVYAAVQEQMDVDSFIDYVVATDFAVNTSWYHNREFWRPRTAGGRWRWVINDFDRGFDSAKLNLSGSGSLYSSPPLSSFRSHYPLFQALENNTNFVNRLIQRYAAHLGSTFQPDRVADKVDALAAEQDSEMARHIARWSGSGGIASEQVRQTELAAIRQFAVNRPAYALSRLKNELGLTRSMYNLTVGAVPAAGGSVAVAGVPLTPEYSTNIALFADTPVQLEATPAPGYRFAGWSTGQTNASIEIELHSAGSISALFSGGAETVLSGTLASDATLSAAASPYAVEGELVVPAGTTLTIDPGVRLRMAPRAGIRIEGALNANGTAAQPVLFEARDGSAWGNLGFVNATGISHLSYVTIRGATRALHDPVNLLAAVSGYNSEIVLDHADIEAAAPVFARFGSTELRNSRVHILFIGDGINVKSGAGNVTGCEFIGNEAPDTDAIDFDNVSDGIISSNRIYAFRGVNSDAIDVGEGCVNLLVIGNRIFNCSDKGVSVGQASGVLIQRNLIVNCDMGVGVKDTGSTAVIDQNTFARNNTGVASFEKNRGAGGGTAFISNCIFSRSKDAPVFVDVLSSLSVDYSLSDTLPLTGTGNLNTDPLFTDAGAYDFSLTAASPAIDAGNPGHAPDADGSRADMGAYYLFDADDYPYLIPNIVVINEVLAHSHATAPDWIELYNTSTVDLDLGGWFLSDDPNQPEKFRIAEGTLLPGGGYLVFYEDADFGAASTNAGALIPFALSENGDTVSLFGPTDGLRPDYTETETFGASLRNVTKGRYYKASTRTFNFVTLLSATPGAANSGPMVGPVVISEIMYNPAGAGAEYLELVNISSNSVTLYDASSGEPWRMTRGIDYAFPTAAPLTLGSGERVLLVNDAAAFAAEYAPPAGVRVFQWTAGKLSNGGETVELSLPGDTNNLGVVQFVRVDRVDYDDAAPWPVSPDGAGDCLTRLDERAYGNDVANWTAAAPTVGRTGYEKWAADRNLPAGKSGPGDDPDGDGLDNEVEYVLGFNPLSPSAHPVWELAQDAAGTRISFEAPLPPADAGYVIQAASDLATGPWVDLDGSTGANLFQALDPVDAGQRYYRLLIRLRNQY